MCRFVILVTLILIPSLQPVLCQSDEDEIKTLIANAPVAEAVAEPPEVYFLIPFGWLVLLAASDNVDSALAAAEKMRVKIGERSHFSAIAFGLVAAGKTDEAMTFANKVTDNNLRASIMAIILTFAGRADEALIEARKIESEQERSVELARMAKFLARTGKFDTASEMAERISDQYEKKETKRVISQEQKNPTRGQKSHTTLLSRLKTALHDARREVLQDMQSAFAEDLARKGRFDEAMNVAREIEDQNVRLEVYEQIAGEMVLQLRFREARIAADMCPDPVSRLGMYGVILQIYAVQKNPELEPQIELVWRYIAHK